MGNYDIGYLRDKLQKKYVQLTVEERKRLIEEFGNKNAGYNDVSIHVELFGEKGTYTDASWKLVFKDEEIAKMISDEVKRQFSEHEDDNNFHKERSVKTITKNGGKYERNFTFEGEKADVYMINLQN